jgi:hypothetical protein
MRALLLTTLFLAACGTGPGPANNSSADPAANVAPPPPSNQAAGNAAEANQAASAPAALSGSREQQVAQVLAAIVPISASRDWDAARAAFPGARWERRTSDANPRLGFTDVLTGDIAIAGVDYTIVINGSGRAVNTIMLSAPEGTVLDRAGLRRALEARGVAWRRTGCMGMTVTVVQLSANGRSTLLSDSVNSGSRVEPSSYYGFSFAEPEYAASDLSQDCED